jgi:hypothetical protein
MAEPTIKRVIEREFAEVQKSREDLLAKRAEIDDQLRALDRRLEAATNYKATLEGKFRTSFSERKTRAPSTRAPRGDRAKLKEKILDLLRQGELTAEAINSELQATEPKEKQKIANVLSLMKQNGAITQEQRRGPYTIAA